MSQSARVTSIEVLREWREAVCVFRTEAQESLCAVEMEIRRTLDRLQERVKFWQDEVRRREELVTQARNDLVRKKMMPVLGREPDTTEEEKVLRRAQARLREAEEKVSLGRKMGPALQRSVEEYEGPARRLGNVIDSDLPRAANLLERKLDALDAYVGTAPPTIARASGAAKPTEEKP